MLVTSNGQHLCIPQQKPLVCIHKCCLLEATSTSLHVVRTVVVFVLRKTMILIVHSLVTSVLFETYLMAEIRKRTFVYSPVHLNLVA